jgi:hypothetical protein
MMRTALQRATSIVVAWVGLLPLSAAMAAPDCPTAATARQGYIVERNRLPMEVIFADDRLVRNILRSTTGETLLETTAFEGLFELERIDRGRRTVSHPTTKLAELFPLKVGKEITANFDIGGAPQIVKSKTVLRLKGKDALFIESCKYDVFVMDKSVGRGDSAPVLFSTDYYSPDLKLIVAKQFKEPNGAPLLNKYDKIYPVKQ